MPAITHKAVDEFLARFSRLLETGQAPSIFLIYGEEVLYKSVLERLLDILVPGDDRKFMYEPFDGVDENLGPALRSANTYALLPGRKVVSLLDSRIFYARQDTAKLLGAAHAAQARGELKKAAGAVMSLSGVLGLGIEDLADSSVRARLEFEKSGVADGAWFDALIDYSLEHGLEPSGGDDAAAVLL